MVCFFVPGIILLGQHFFARAYDSEVAHPYLTYKIAQVFNQQTSNKLNSRDIKWLEQGSIDEDNFPRWMNHFYDPSAGKGLWGFASAKDWAQSGWQTFNWEKALNFYVKGDRQSAMIALGHVLHLVEDMGVPAHTRNDAHPEGDPYENWVTFNIVGRLNSPVSPMTINSLDEAFAGVADYSHDYFLSKDTIGGLNINNDNLRTVTLKNGLKRLYSMRKDKLSDVDYKLIRVQIDGLNRKNYILDDPLVHSDYLSLLAPKVISHSAGVVDLFFREAEIKKQQEGQKTWQEKFKQLIGNKLFAGIGASLFSLPSAALWDNRQISTGPKSTSTGDSSPILETSPPLQQAPNLAPKTPPVVKQKITPFPDPQPNDGSHTQEEKNDNLDQPTLPQQPKQQNPPDDNQGGSQLEQPKEKRQEEIPPMGETNGGSAPVNGPVIPSVVDYPETTIDEAPAGTASATFAVFSFSSDKPGGTFLCKIDREDFKNCSSPKTYQNLIEGEHYFNVYAIGDQGRMDPTPASRTWQIDFTGPTASNINVNNITKNSAHLDFGTNEAAKFQIFWGATENYGRLSSASFGFASSHSYDFSGLDPETTYHFKIETGDRFGNQAFSLDQTFTTASALADHLVISEAQTAGQTAGDEWIEIYNPTRQSIDLANYSLQYRGSEAQNYYRKNFPDGTIIPARKFYLVANSDYGGPIVADTSYSGFSLSGTGGTIFLVDNQVTLDASSTSEHVVDRVAYGVGSYLYPESLEFTPAPAVFQSVERKACSDSTATSLASGLDKYSANAFDSGNNSFDFVLQNHPDPQNSASPSEPRNTLSTTWSSAQEVARETGTASVNFPKILIKSDTDQEIIWHDSNIIFNNAYNKKRAGGVLDDAETLISNEWTRDKLISGDVKILENAGKTYAFFAAIPFGFERMLFVSEKTAEGWSVPASMTFINPAYSAGWDLALDPNSAVHFAWQDNNSGKTYYQSCALGLGTVCQEAQDLNQNNVLGIHLFIDVSGSPLITYLRNSDKTIRERSFDGATWNDELVIQTTVPSGSLAQYNATLDDVGNLHFVWCEEEARGTNRWDYYWATKNNGSVTVKEKFAQGLGQRNGLAITVNQGGDLYVLSTNQGRSYQELTLWGRQGGVWSAPQKIADQSQAGDYEYGYIVTSGTSKVFITWKSQENTICKVYLIEGSS